MSNYGEIHFKEVKDIFTVLIMISIFFLVFSVSYIVVAIAIDFSKAFILFHKIIFNNDYWIFDPSTDPVINALPEELFMIYGLVILAIVIGVAVIIKVNKRKIFNMKNSPYLSN